MSLPAAPLSAVWPQIWAGCAGYRFASAGLALKVLNRPAFAHGQIELDCILQERD